MRAPHFVVASLAASLAAVDAPAKPILTYVDHKAADQAATIPAASLDQVRGLNVVLASAPKSAVLSEGLQILARQQPERFRLTVAEAPGRDFKGVASYTVGNLNRPDSRLKDFGDGFKSRFSGSANAAQIIFDANDLPDGRRVEVGYTQYSATMDINLTHSDLQSVFVENLIAPRFTGGSGTRGGLLIGFFVYPIELPNMRTDTVKTTARVPIGLDTNDPNLGPQGAAPVAANPWPRDPRVAFDLYRQQMESLEKANPSMVVVWNTMPLNGKENAQRTWFNGVLRKYAVDHGKTLFDLAAIQSHDSDGELQFDSQGEVLAKQYQNDDGRLNELGKERLARAWWVLMAKVQGWKPEV